MVGIVAKGLRTLNPDCVIPLHCSGFRVITRLSSLFRDGVHLLNVGD